MHERMQRRLGSLAPVQHGSQAHGQNLQRGYQLIQRTNGHTIELRPQFKGQLRDRQP